MKLRKKLSILIAAILMFFVSVQSINVSADEVTKETAVPTVRAVANNEGNYIHLDWTPPDADKYYSYKLFSKESSEPIFQSIPSKANVKVLNVYPSVGNNLKGWMESKGKGLITVDEVDIDVFNKDFASYLKDSTGEWKYDVIMFGSWDNNNEKDISSTAAAMVDQFIKAGRGVLFGHDTVSSVFPDRNFKDISLKYLDMDIDGSYYGDGVTYGRSTGVKIYRKGLLTNYPYNIGDVGTTLTIPLAHNVGQIAHGDIWMKFDNTDDSNPCNFYLTTLNNVAMIQTGHSNGTATDDEQKVLANTLFYLAQVTEDIQWDDHKGQDLAAPTKPNIRHVTYDNAYKSATICFDTSTDKGSSYDYYVEATEKSTGNRSKSDITTETVTTGIKGYSIVVDQKKDTVPDNSIETTISEGVVNADFTGDFYVHVAAVDNADNISEVSTYKYSYPKLKLTENTTEEVRDNVTIKAEASDADYGIAKIVTPDGKVVEADSTDYVVNENGTYTFTAVDKEGHETTSSIEIKNILPPVVLNVEPNFKNFYLNETVIVDLTMDNITDIAAEDIRVKYDSSKLEFTGFNKTEGIIPVKTSVKDGEIRFIFASKGAANVVNAKTVLAKLYFKPKAGGDAVIDVTKGRVSDGIAMEKDLRDAECGETTINIVNKNFLSVDPDSEDFTLLDLAIIARHYGEDPASLRPEYETDALIDGDINDDDLTKVADLMLKNPNYKF